MALPVAPPSTGSSTGGVGGYGDGSDGNATMDGATTVIGIVPSANTYTLARDSFFNNLTINPGISLITNGFRLFVAGTLTNNGTIQWNGAPGIATGAAPAVTGNTNSSFISGSGAAAPGTAGGAGGTAAGTAGTNQSGTGLGGAGGAGGAGSGGAGGAGGTVGLIGTSTGPPRWFPYSMMGRVPIGAGTGAYQGGAGGGGGGGDATAAASGGSGGGVVYLAAKTIGGTGAIQARGGAGATPGAGNRGGGGGGGGGLVVVTSQSASAGAIPGQTIDANPGALGNGIGTGANGVAGSAGLVIVVQN